MLCEATTGFALHGMIYSGREENNAPHQNLANNIVMHLCSVVDRCFTAHGLYATYFSKTYTGWHNYRMSNRHEIPSQFKSAEFLKRLSFQLAQPYVRKKKLIGQTKLFAERTSFIDAAPHSSQRKGGRSVKRGKCQAVRGRCSR